MADGHDHSSILAPGPHLVLDVYYTQFVYLFTCYCLNFLLCFSNCWTLLIWSWGCICRKQFTEKMRFLLISIIKTYNEFLNTHLLRNYSNGWVQTNTASFLVTIDVLYFKLENAKFSFDFNRNFHTYHFPFHHTHIPERMANTNVEWCVKNIRPFENLTIPKKWWSYATLYLFNRLQRMPDKLFPDIDSYK